MKKSREAEYVGSRVCIIVEGSPSSEMRQLFSKQLYTMTCMGMQLAAIDSMVRGRVSGSVG